MGAKSKRKGNRIEREMVHLHKAVVLPARRVPFSGAAAAFSGELAGDVVIDLADGKTLERWLGSHDLLFLRRDRAGPLVLMRFDLYARLVGWQGNNGGV